MALLVWGLFWPVVSGDDFVGVALVLAGCFSFFFSVVLQINRGRDSRSVLVDVDLGFVVWLSFLFDFLVSVVTRC